MRASIRLKQLRRYRSLVSSFARNGLGYVTQEMGLSDRLFVFRNKTKEEHSSASLGERIRLLLEELGPTFVKLGQIASTRPDLMPDSIVSELKLLQDHVHPFSYEEAIHIVEHELGVPVEHVFSAFEKEPLAAASIGQVHQATLLDGTAVVVKVQRPHIQSLIETDLMIMKDWAALAESRMEWARSYRLVNIVQELGEALRTELDFRIEARNTKRFQEQCKKLKHIQVPNVFLQWSTERVLTMTYIEGIKLSDIRRLEVEGLDRRQIAERYAHTILYQMLIEGFFHGDPHPGNILVMADGSLALLDFGMTGRMTPQMKKNFASIVISLRNHSTKGMLKAISNMGIIPNGINEDALYADIDELRDKYYRVDLQDISLGSAVNELLALAYKHQIRIPAELTLLGKALLTMEGVVTELAPDLSIFDIAEPFGKKLLVERLKPRRLINHLIEDVPDYLTQIREVPLSINRLSAVMNKGQLQIEASSPQMEAILRKLDRIGNRLSFSIVLLSLSIVVVGLVLRSVLSDAQTSFWQLPIIEVGFLVIMLMVAWLIYTIVRSGRF